VNAAVLFRRAAMLQVLLALAAFAVADRNAWFLIAGGTLTVASSYVTQGPRGRFLPNWLVSLGIVLAMVWGAANLLDQPNLRDSSGIVGTVVLTILVCKLFGRKGASDWRQILALTVVMVIAAALNSVDLLAGLLVMAYGGTALGAVMLYQLFAGARTAEVERQAALALALGAGAGAGAGSGAGTGSGGGSATGAPSSAKRRPVLSADTHHVLPSVPVVSGAHALRHFRRMLALSCLTGLLMSVVVFLLFPRDAVLGDRWQGRGRQSGFNDELVLMSNDRLSLSAREVFSVKMLDPQGVPAQFVGPLHLRGAVLDVYSVVDRRWISSERRAEQFTSTVGSERGGAFTPFAPEALQERANVWTQVVEMRSLASRYVFSMWLPIAIATPDERTFALNAQTAVIKDEIHDGSGRPRSYSVRVQPFPGPRIVRAVCPASTMQHSVGFPVPKLVELSQQLLAESGMPDLGTAQEAEQNPELRYERNRRIARWFTEYLSKGDFQYTTDLSGFRSRQGEDPNVSFLTRYKFGHCEFFASALAALCRSAGVEARVVTGFLVSEYDNGSSEYVVREANAHAWVEVRTGEWQWSTFEPSPTEALLATQNANRSWLDGFRWVLDPLEFAWQSRVVNFDSGSQAEMAQRVTGGVEGTLRAVADWAQQWAAEVNRGFRLGPAGYIWLGLVAVVLAIGVVAVAVIVRRDRLVRSVLGGAHDPAVRRAQMGRDAGFYLDALDVMAKGGLGKPRWRTPKAHAEAVQEVAGSAIGSAFMAVVDRFYEVRYAGRRPRRWERTQDAALVAALRSALARGHIGT
jgi:transglutaminase-like putative cysteine protease